MFKISHRGNMRGPDLGLENKPEHVASLLRMGYHVEIDVRTSPDYKTLYLGHDERQYMIPESFLQQPNLWCHAKDAGALLRLSALNVHYFWHDVDDLVLTSYRIPWIHPKVDLKTYPLDLIRRSVLVMPERSPTDREYANMCYAVCTDYME